MSDVQELQKYMLPSYVNEDVVKQLGKEAVIVDGGGWHEYKVEDEQRRKPFVLVQFPESDSLLQYRIPASVMKKFFEEFKSLERTSWVGAKIKFEINSKGFTWIDCNVMEKPNAKPKD